MARFRVWDGRVNTWRDCVDVPMFTLDADGKWIPLLPRHFSVANQYGNRWHEIDDTFDPVYDDPCDTVEAEGCDGAPTSTTRGSGDGTGSKGPVYTQLDGYPPGYDLPDAGRSGFGLVLNGAAPTGRAISRPGIHREESYDPSGLGSRFGLGTYANPNVPYNSVTSRGAAITETVYAIPQREGYVEVMFASYDAYGISVDIYHMGLRVASTCGKVTGRGRLGFKYNPNETDQRIMIRVRAETGAGWSLMPYPPRLIATSDRGNLSLDYQIAYDAIRFPDLINTEYLGTPVFPAPCHAAVWAVPERIVNANAFEYFHYVGPLVGRMILDYTSWENFDYFEVYHAGRRIATTLDSATGRGYLEFLYDPKDTDQFDIMVRVVGSDFKSGPSLETQYYSLYCPDTRGARTYRHACEAYTIESAGHTTTEDCIELGMQTDRRAVSVSVSSGSFPTKFEVFDSAMTLLDTEILGAHERGTLEFWKETYQPLKSNITVRVTSEVGSDWRYFVWCPVQLPQLEHRDLLLTHNCVEILGGEQSPADHDPFPWFAYTFQQLGGRGVGSDISALSTLDDNFFPFWGGVSGYIKFNNYFLRPVKKIYFTWIYRNTNGWHGRFLYEKNSGYDTRVYMQNSPYLEQHHELVANVPAGEEIWLYTDGPGNQGDMNRPIYLAITDVEFGD